VPTRGTSTGRDGGPRILGRRAVLAAGVAVAAGLTIRSRPAQAGELTVGDLVYGVPAGVVPADPGDLLGRSWQWRGRTDDSQISPRGVVLVRADLETAEPVEVLGLLLASTAAGLLPDVRLVRRRSRVVQGGQQTRFALSYALDRTRRYGGELVVAARPDATSGLVVVLGDGTVPTSFFADVLDPGRWRS
jgi:hypothetical protein